MFELKEAGDSLGVDVVGHGRATQFDGAGEHVDQGLPQAFQLSAGDARSLAARPDAGASESLVGVDVADAVKERLIQQRRLDRGATAAKESGEVNSGDGQGLGTGAGVGRTVDGEAAKAPWVDEA